MSTISAGTTVPTGITLTADTTGALTFQVSGTVTAATLNTSGNLLVGTTSAISTSTARLQVAGSGVTAGLTLARTDAPTSGASFAAIDAWSSDGSAYVVGGTINFRAAENWTSTNHGTDIQFRATASGSGGALFEAMRITSAGNVGIGTTSAAAGGLLTLNRAPAAAFGTPMLQIGGASFTSGGYYSVGLGFTDATYTEPPGEIAFVTTSDSGGTLGSIVFGTRSVTTNTAVTERMRIDSSGNVGIGGTANAWSKLNITGTLASSGNNSLPMYVDGTIPSGTTSQAQMFRSNPTTQATSFTLSNLSHFNAGQQTFGAGSTVSNQFGFFAGNSLTGATNNFGFYSDIASGSNRWNFYAAGTANNYFAGNVGINVSPISVFKLHVAAATNVTVGIADGTGVAGALTFNAVNNANSANVPLDFRSSATYFSAGIGTTGSAANAYIDNTANNQLLRSTSSLRYKRDVATYTRGLSELMTLRAVSFKGISESDGDKTFAGLIAEEVHDAGLTEFVVYDKEGRPDALHYGNMVALAFKAIQELKAENDALKVRIEALETK